jgi:hypothetical protein
MIRIIVFLFSVSLLQTSFGQYYIRGKVTDEESKLPLKGASVYLNNTTRGTTTDEHGDFTLGPLDAGRYEVVASYVGYEPLLYLADVKTQSYRIRFQLVEKDNTMREVLALTNETRRNYLEIFRKNVLGYSRAADKCNIKNIEEVQFTSGKTPEEIHAYADVELEIENPELGYTIYFTLVDFFYNKRITSTHFYGYTRFVDQDADEREKKKYLRKRRLAYEGSTMHFFRGLVKKELAKEGFKVYTRKGAIIPVEDSLIRLYSDSVYRVYELLVNDGWRIFYKKNTALKNEMINKSMAGLQPQISTISGLRIRESPALLSEKGVLLTPIRLYYDYIWAFERLANMLPEDYEDK